jgi:NADP-dependent 3-hydroxy acid dehydrogenase YdfG
MKLQAGYYSLQPYIIAISEFCGRSLCEKAWYACCWPCMQVMAVNARGVFLCLKHQIPLMLETAAGHGAIVITSSVAGGAGSSPAAAATKLTVS